MEAAMRKSTAISLLLAAALSSTALAQGPQGGPTGRGGMMQGWQQSAPNANWGWMGPGMMGAGWGWMGPGMMGQGWGPGGGAMMYGFDPSSHIEGRLAFLKTELKITDAQTEAWDTFAAVARKSAGAMYQSMQAMRQAMQSRVQSNQAFPAPDHLKLMEDTLSARLDQVKALRKSTAALYKVLSDEQKKTADVLLVGPWGMM
jgi:hypothetical protein